MVEVKDDGTMEMVAVGGDMEEMQDYKGSQREEYMQVDEGGGAVKRAAEEMLQRDRMKGKTKETPDDGYGGE